MQVTKLFLWILAGVFSIIGTILVGKGVSVLVRPVFILRYLFPVSMLAWLIFAVCVSRLKGRATCACICMACLFCLIGPTYKMLYEYEKNEAELSENIYELPIERDAVIVMRMMDCICERGRSDRMKKESKKRIDMYDIGEGLTLMIVIEKNDSGKMRHITTYIGIECNGFVCVGNANDLDAPGAIFSYQSYVREQEAMLPFLIDIFETNTGVK